MHRFSADQGGIWSVRVMILLVGVVVTAGTALAISPKNMAQKRIKCPTKYSDFHLDVIHNPEWTIASIPSLKLGEANIGTSSKTLYCNYNIMLTGGAKHFRSLRKPWPKGYTCTVNSRKDGYLCQSLAVPTQRSTPKPRVKIPRK